MEKLSTVYADNAATTAMSRTAVEAMLPYLDKIYGNPSSLHSVGQVAKEALEVARADMLPASGQSPTKFTSLPAAAKAIIRQSALRRTSARSRAKSI